MGSETEPTGGGPAGRTGRPVSFDRDEAIDAAMQIFWRKGYLAVSSSELADAMGIRRSSFYNSFVSREAVFQEALEHYGQIAPDRALDLFGPDKPVLPVIVQVFRDLCRARADDKQARGCMVCNAAGEVIGVDEEIGPVISQALAARIRSLEVLLRRAVDRGELPRKTDVPSVSRAVVCFLIGINTLSKVLRSEQQLWATAQTFLRGLGFPA